MYFAIINAAAAAQGFKYGGATGAVAAVVIQDGFVIATASVGLINDNVSNYTSTVNNLKNLIADAKATAAANPQRAQKLNMAANDLQIQLFKFEKAHPIIGTVVNYGQSGLAPLGTLNIIPSR